MPFNRAVRSGAVALSLACLMGVGVFGQEPGMPPGQNVPPATALILGQVIDIGSGKPVAGMTDVETETTAHVLREVNKSHSVVVVEHAVRSGVSARSSISLKSIFQPPQSIFMLRFANRISGFDTTKVAWDFLNTKALAG